MPSFAIVMPKDAEILTVQLQGGKPVLWALVETETAIAPNVDRHFELLVTGGPLDTHDALAFDAGRLRYVNTFQFNDWALVYHLFQYRSGD